MSNKKKKKVKKPDLFRGVYHQRINQKMPRGHINLEKIFYEEWKKEHENCSNTNFGMGRLQDMLIEKDGMSKNMPGADYVIANRWECDREVMVYKVTPRDHAIVATVIQWLGSNVGFSFLATALKKGGFSIEQRR